MKVVHLETLLLGLSDDSLSSELVIGSDTINSGLKLCFENCWRLK
jgi:hypothetical protein